MYSIKNLCLISASAMILASVVSASEIDNGKISIFLNDDSHIHSHTYNAERLKPMPKGSYQTAALFFLPDLDDSNVGFGGYDQIANDYNRGNCGEDGSLFTTSNCSYPRALVASSQCPFQPGSYTQCDCLPEFKISSCPAPKSLSSPLCNGKAQRCICPPPVALINPNDQCTQYCDGLCITKNCTPLTNEIGCLYGTTTASDNCGGTRTVCKACVPLASETGCSYGTTTSSDNCGGTRTICNICIPLTSESGCSYGTTTASDNCGGTRTICLMCSKPVCTSISFKPSNSSYTTASCTDCTGTKTINNGWSCSSGYHKNGSSCILDTASVGDILYSDMTTSSNLIAGKTPIGIVFNGEKRLALGLHHFSNGHQFAYGYANSQWLSEQIDIPQLENKSQDAALTDWNGKENNKTVLNYCKTTGKRCPTFEYANEYITEGTKSGDWYIPSLAETVDICNHIKVLNPKLQIVNGDRLDYGGVWSSTERNESNAWAPFVGKDETCSIDNYSHPKDWVRRSLPVINY